MQEVFRRVRKAAASDVTLLVLGESGTGKELVARAIHEQSARHTAPFVPVNSAALAPSILESELFGHEKGAFTGASQRRIGLIEAAHRGTLFLDEIGDMPLQVQVKLLRVIENREIQRVGSSSPVRVDVRIVAATHKNLEDLVQEGKFREDLYFRLSGVQIELPPLRERLGDLEILVGEFLAGSSEATGKGITEVSTAVLDRFRAYAWPGNLRELRKFIDAMVVEDEDGMLDLDDIPAHIDRLLHRNPVKPADSLDLQQVLQKHVLHVLAENHWHFLRSAEDLGVDRKTLRRWLRKWGIPSL